jgi:hypothetical protein
MSSASSSACSACLAASACLVLLRVLLLPLLQTASSWSSDRRGHRRRSLHVVATVVPRFSLTRWPPRVPLTKRLDYRRLAAASVLADRHQRIRLPHPSHRPRARRSFKCCLRDGCLADFISGPRPVPGLRRRSVGFDSSWDRGVGPRLQALLDVCEGAHPAFAPHACPSLAPTDCRALCARAGHVRCDGRRRHRPPSPPPPTRLRRRGNAATARTLGRLPSPSPSPWSRLSCTY